MMRLRQIALVARDLRPVERALIDAFDLEVCFRDPGLATFGLRHGLYAIGDRLLEVVSPKQDGTTAGRYLDRRGGDGGYMVLVQVDDLEAHRERLAGTEIRIVHEAKGDGITGLHLHPADVGGAIVSIDRSDPPESPTPSSASWRPPTAGATAWPPPTSSPSTGPGPARPSRSAAPASVSCRRDGTGPVRSPGAVC